MSQTYQNDGYVTESVGPISIYQAALGIAAASGAAATLYQTNAGTSAVAVPSTSSSPAAAAPVDTPAGDADTPDEP
jgi:hypothetical protein